MITICNLSLKGHLGWNYFILDYFYILLGLFVMLERYPAPKFSFNWFLPRFHFNKGGHLPPSLLPGIEGKLAYLRTEPHGAGQDGHRLLTFPSKCSAILELICSAFTVALTTHDGNLWVVPVVQKM